MNLHYTKHPVLKLLVLMSFSLLLIVAALAGKASSANFGSQDVSYPIRYDIEQAFTAQTLRVTLTVSNTGHDTRLVHFMIPGDIKLSGSDKHLTCIPGGLKACALTWTVSLKPGAHIKWRVGFMKSGDGPYYAPPSVTAEDNIDYHVMTFVFTGGRGK